MSYTPKRLQHANIFVRDATKSQEWYEDVFGLHTYDFDPGHAAFLSADLEQSHEIALVEVGEDAPGPEQGRVGLNHISWKMESLEDLRELYERVKARNIPIEHVDDHGIAVAIYFRDPDGNGIEITYELPRSQWHSQERIYEANTNLKGRFPGPWHDEPDQRITGTPERVETVPR